MNEHQASLPDNGSYVLRSDQGPPKSSEDSLVFSSQILRGIAILFVIIQHVLDQAQYRATSKYGTFFVLTTFFVKSGVPIFVVLSGFALSLGGVSRALSRRRRKLVLERMVPSVVCWYVIYWIMQNHRSLSLGLLLKDFVTLNHLGVLWFMVLIIQLYLLFPWLYRIYCRFRSKTALLVWTLFIQTGLNALIASLVPPESSMFFRLHSLFIFHVFYFLLGMALRDYRVECLRTIQRVGVPIAVAVVLGAVGFSLTLESVRMPPGVFYMLCYTPAAPLISVGMFVLVWLLADRIRQKAGLVARVLSTFGLYSFGIYLFHVTAVLVCFRALRLAGVSEDSLIPLFVMFVVAVTSLYAVKWMSRWPLAKYYLQ